MAGIMRAIVNDSSFAKYHGQTETIRHSFEQFSIATPFLQHCLVAIVLVGLLLNTIQFASVSELLKRKQMARVAGRYLRWQAIFDGSVCLVIIPVSFNEASMPLPRTAFPQLTTVLAYIVCHAWYSQYLFWQCQLYSVFNLMLLSIDRCVAIKFSMRHDLFVQRQKPFVACLYVLGFLFAAISALYCTVEFELNQANDSGNAANSTTASANASVVEGAFQCKMGSQLFSSSFTHGYSLVWFLLGYAIPGLIMIICYLLMIASLINESHSTTFQQQSSVCSKTMLQRNTKIKNATRQLIKIVILMGLSFIVCLCLDSVNTLLDAFGLHSYVFNTPVQKLGMMLIAVNCAVGPGVTFLLVPLLRKTAISVIRRTLCCCISLREHNSISIVSL